MQLDDFQKQALQSIAITDKSVAALAHRTLGLTGEAGIIGNAVKKVIRDRGGGALSDAEAEFLKEKLGDVLYYVAALADYADISLDDIAKSNLQKSANFKANRESSKY